MSSYIQWMFVKLLPFLKMDAQIFSHFFSYFFLSNLPNVVMSEKNALMLPIFELLFFVKSLMLNISYRAFVFLVNWIYYNIYLLFLHNFDKFFLLWIIILCFQIFLIHIMQYLLVAGSLLRRITIIAYSLNIYSVVRNLSNSFVTTTFLMFSWRGYLWHLKYIRFFVRGIIFDY